MSTAEFFAILFVGFVFYQLIVSIEEKDKEINRLKRKLSEAVDKISPSKKG